MRAWPVLLLLVALLIRGVTPTGWMPNPQGLAGSPFVICTSDGAHVVSLDRDGHPTQPATGDRHERCVFASPAAAPAAQALLYLGSTHVEAPEAAKPTPAAPPASAQRHRDQAARAPPILV